MNTDRQPGLLRGVIFDLDGTLIRQELDFEAMRREIGVPSGTPLLEAVERLPAEERERAVTVLLHHENAAAELATLHDGVAEAIAWLDGLGVRRGLLSRNCRTAVRHVLDRCGLQFDQALAREDAPYKPNPEGIWRICRAWGFDPSEVLMVGDYVYDLQAGRNAGTKTALITHGKIWPFADQADVCFSSFAEFSSVFRRVSDME